MRTRLLSLAVLVMSLIAPAAADAQSRNGDRTPWIHVRVEEGRDGANVELNLPLSLVEIALEMAEEDMLVSGHMKLDHCEVSVAEMRRMWAELRHAGDADFVSVEEDDETVKIYRRGSMVYVDVTEGRTGGEKARLEIPISVVDALFEDDEGLNLRAALAELNRVNEGQILSVDDGESRVRIWID